MLICFVVVTRIVSLVYFRINKRIGKHEQSTLKNRGINLSQMYKLW